MKKKKNRMPHWRHLIEETFNEHRGFSPHRSARIGGSAMGDARAAFPPGGRHPNSERQSWSGGGGWGIAQLGEIACFFFGFMQVGPLEVVEGFIYV